MTDNQLSKTIKTFKTQNTNLFTFFATLGGVVVGVASSMAMVGPMLQSQVASATKDTNRTVAVRPASLTDPSDPSFGFNDACVVPSGQAVAPSAQAAMAPSAPGGEEAPLPVGMGGGGEMTMPPSNSVNKANKNVFVKVNKQINKNEASISNTGPDSVNKITQVNKTSTKVDNTNIVNVKNINPQHAESGDVDSEENTTTGDATNTSNSDFNVTVKN